MKPAHRWLAEKKTWLCVILMYAAHACAQVNSFPYDTTGALKQFEPGKFLIHQNAGFSVIDSLIITGNRHTKDFVILNELTFSAGDSLLTQDADYIDLSASRSNVINTGIFLDVTFILKETAPGHYFCIISVKERWDVFPKPWFDISDRNFNVWWVEYDHDLGRTEYGVDLVWYNFTGRHDDLEVKTIFGFTKKLELFYNLPQLAPYSEFGAGLLAAYIRNKEIAFTTEENKLIFTQGDDYLRTKFRAGFFVNFRSDHYNFHRLMLKYNFHSIADTITEINPDYFLNGRTTQEFPSLIYSYTNNKVNDRSYPTEGHYAKVQVSGIGLGLSDDINQFGLLLQYNQYGKIANNLFLQAEGQTNFLFAKEYPYFNIISLGYCENFVRGYEYYVMDGEQTYLFRSNLKYKLFTTNFRVPLLHWEQFNTVPVGMYLKIFADAGYVADNRYSEMNPLVNKTLYSGGAGFDITTYYDWVFRIEAAVNALGEFGLYLHLALDLNTYEDCSLW